MYSNVERACILAGLDPYIGIIREVLAFKNSYLLVILFIVPSFLIVLHMILKDSIYINKRFNKRFGIFRCAYIILLMIIYIYENYKLPICELEIIACVSVIILTVLGTFLTTTKKEEQGIGEFFVLISIFINGLLFIL